MSDHQSLSSNLIKTLCQALERVLGDEGYGALCQATQLAVKSALACWTDDPVLQDATETITEFREAAAFVLADDGFAELCEETCTMLQAAYNMTRGIGRDPDALADSSN